MVMADEEQIRDIAKPMLSKIGHEVLLVWDGVEDAVFSYIKKKLLNSANVTSIVDIARAKWSQGDNELVDLEKRLKKIQGEVDKFIDHYLAGY